MIKYVQEGALRAYTVVTPEYEMSWGDYYEPPEYGRDYRLVFARNARRAKLLALRAWRRMNKHKLRPQKKWRHIEGYLLQGLQSSFIADCDWDNISSPFKFIKAERLEYWEED
jgi:hypothetical protein